MAWGWLAALIGSALGTFFGTLLLGFLFPKQPAQQQPQMPIDISEPFAMMLIMIPMMFTMMMMFSMFSGFFRVFE